MKPVMIYTSSQCEYCHGLKMFLDKHNVEYTEVNISTDKEARKDIMKKGYMSVPLIMVEDKVLVGFDEKEVTALLDL